MATNSIKLLTGNSHPQLAKLVADRYVEKTSIYEMGESATDSESAD